MIDDDLKSQTEDLESEVADMRKRNVAAASSVKEFAGRYRNELKGDIAVAESRSK
jgi:hypothetical protein